MVILFLLLKLWIHTSFGQWILNQNAWGIFFAVEALCPNVYLIFRTVQVRLSSMEAFYLNSQHWKQGDIDQGRQSVNCRSVLIAPSQTEQCQLMPHNPDPKQHGGTDLILLVHKYEEKKKIDVFQCPENWFLNRQQEQMLSASSDWPMGSLFRRQAS